MNFINVSGEHDEATNDAIFTVINDDETASEIERIVAEGEDVSPVF